MITLRIYLRGTSKMLSLEQRFKANQLKAISRKALEVNNNPLLIRLRNNQQKAIRRKELVDRPKRFNKIYTRHKRTYYLDICVIPLLDNFNYYKKR